MIFDGESSRGEVNEVREREKIKSPAARRVRRRRPTSTSIGVDHREIAVWKRNLIENEDEATSHCTNCV